MDEMCWNRDRLYELVRSRLGDRKFIIVSNREPYIHTLSGEKIEWYRPVSGLTEALDPVMRASGGTWVAQGTGDADRKVVDNRDCVAVPPDKPEYSLRRVWLTEDEEAGFYLGFANEALWPLCHITFTSPTFSEDSWLTYRRVNRIFADAVIQEAGGRQAVVMVQDYHFAMLPGFLREQAPHLIIGQFWHIPWPPYEVFRACPWHEEILTGMLGNDLLGFHTRSFCNNFVECVERSLEARTDRERFAVIRQGKTTAIQPFPISVDFDGISLQAVSGEVDSEMETLRQEYDLEGKFIGIGIDRMDYTKGILERLLALDKLFEDFPEYRGKVVFIQAGMPSRSQIDTYQAVSHRITDLMNSINNKYGSGPWQPVISLSRQLSHETLHALRRLATFCVVSSLHDGMNLVAKEFVSARADGDGVLILSRFAGAASELRDALLINPYDTADFARKIKEAIEMPEEERRLRMKKMRGTVSASNIYRWGASIVSELISIAEA